MTTGRLFVAGLLAVVLAMAATADVVKMRNGDTVTGKVARIADGKITITTDYMGDVSIDMAKVQSLSTEGAYAVTYGEGLQATGALSYADGAELSVAAEGAPITVPLGGVASAVTPEEAAAAKMPKWWGSFETGINGQTGNSEILQGNARVDVKRAYLDTLWGMFAQSRYGRQDGLRSADQQLAGARYEELLDTDWFWFSALDLERDGLRDLAFRATATTGLGYVWWNHGPADYWKTSAGPGVTYVRYHGGEDDWSPVAQATSDYSKSLSKKVMFADLTKLTTDLSDMEGFRAENDAALLFPLTDTRKWLLKLGLSHRYDNMPAPDTERLDTYYYLNAVRTF